MLQRLGFRVESAYPVAASNLKLPFHISSSKNNNNNNSSNSNNDDTTNTNSSCTNSIASKIIAVCCLLSMHTLRLHIYPRKCLLHSDAVTSFSAKAS